MIYDPLCLLSPNISNLKIAYRNVCKKVKDWDEKIGFSELKLVTRMLEKLLKVQSILLPRAAFLQGSERYNPLFFLDTSDDITQTSVLVQNKFVDREINGILMNKIKLCDSSMGKTLRKDLGAANQCSRVKEIVCYHLGAFLDRLGVPWNIDVLSDSTIVLFQIAFL